MFSSKKPDNSPGAHACFSYMPATLHIIIMFVTSLNDVTIICHPFWWESTAHVQESHNGLPVHLLVSLLTVSYSYALTCSSIPYPKFQACDTLPQVFWWTLIPESVID